MVSEKELSTTEEVGYNKSVFFILPVLGLPLQSFSNLINCYISDINKAEYKQYHLFILNSMQDDWLRGIKGFEEEYQVKEGFMYVYKIPEQFEEDYLKFMLGKYSTFSTEYKNSIYKLIRGPFKNSNVYKVLNKSPELKKSIETKIGMSIGDQEVLSAPDHNKEFYG